MFMVLRVSVLELIDIWEMWQFLLNETGHNGCYNYYLETAWGSKHAHNNLIGNKISFKLVAFSSRHI